MSSSIQEQLAGFGVLPVVALGDVESALPLADALAEGGLGCLEVLFRTQAAGDIVRRVKDHRPSLLLGAGTLLTPEQVKEAVQAGASFLVSPGFNQRVVNAAQDLGVPIFPGVLTPTEIEQALEFGLDTLKFFPAEPVGGLSFLRALGGPYPNVRWMPSGGITASNLASYLREASVLACCGTWMVESQLLDSHDFAAIQRLAGEASGIVRSLESRPMA